MIEEVFTLSTPFLGVYSLQRLRFGEGRPHLVVVSGLHGNELNGIHAINLLATTFRSQRPRGTVDLYPIVNTFGIDEGRKRGPFQDEDLNQAFPGDPEGTAAQRIARAILDATDADVCVDVHSGSPMVHEMPQIRASLSGPEVELARQMGMPLLWRRPSSTLDKSSLVGAWRQQGRIAMRLTAGRGATLNKPEALSVADGLHQLMAAMGLTSGETTRPTVADVTHEELTFHRSGTGGFFVPEVQVGDAVRPGHLLGRIVAPVGGETLEEIRADRTGVVVTLRVYPMVHASELLVRVAAVGH